MAGRAFGHTGTKYGNRKTVIDGITFDSQKEANRYCELKLLWRAGEIESLEVQPRFELAPAVRINGKALHKIEYVADFSYTDAKNDQKIVEDVKSAMTRVLPTYRLKRNLFIRQHPDVMFLET